MDSLPSRQSNSSQREKKQKERGEDEGEDEGMKIIEKVKSQRGSRARWLVTWLRFGAGTIA